VVHRGWTSSFSFSRDRFAPRLLATLLAFAPVVSGVRSAASSENAPSPPAAADPVREPEVLVPPSSPPEPETVEPSPNTESGAVESPSPETAAPPPETEPVPQLEFAPFHDKLFLEARRSGDPVGLYFEADWCQPCRKMHASTFREPAVLEAAAGFRLFRVDMTRRSAYLDLLEKSFDIVGAPTVILFGPDGREAVRRFGFLSAGELIRMLEDSRKPLPSS
jgi:thiol-disulfide isomerase/thioredoxin